MGGQSREACAAHQHFREARAHGRSRRLDQLLFVAPLSLCGWRGEQLCLLPSAAAQRRGVRGGGGCKDAASRMQKARERREVDRKGAVTAGRRMSAAVAMQLKPSTRLRSRGETASDARGGFSAASDALELSAFCRS